MRVVGLMSGTSADGIDAVLVSLSGSASKPKWSILNFVSTAYPNELRRKLIEAGQGKKFSSFEWLELSEEVTEIHAIAARACVDNHEYDLVGCHGQTVCHRAPKEGRLGGSSQLIKAPLLAHFLARPVIHDFRSADIAIGGQGAPLVPLADEALLGRLPGWRAVLNLGGISNLTLIPPLLGPDCKAPVLGWDCGPANSLIDLAIEKISHGEYKFDPDGLLAGQGKEDESIIQEWLKEPYFHLPPPKSTGREQFGCHDLNNRMRQCGRLSHSDFLATLTAFTAAVVAQDLEHLWVHKFIRPFELLLAGGGLKNRSILNELRNRCNGMQIKSIEEYGLPALAREALAFAVLAWWHVLKHPGNSKFVTGAKRSVVLGMRADPV